jgi:glycosyltransferase involved in cell wall biosynthesis
MGKKKVLLFANTDWYLYNFREKLATRLKGEGWDVFLVSPSGKYVEKLLEKGFKWIPFDFSTRSFNPLRELLVVLRLRKLYSKERPTIAHHFTIKCVIYGTIAARVVGGIKVVNAVTGLGHIFIGEGIMAGLLRPLVQVLYRFVLSKKNGRVIFENSENRDMFVRNNLAPIFLTHVIRGAGVDCERFRPIVSNSSAAKEVIRVLFASRMLKEKGVYELLKAARIIKKKGLQVEFVFAGDTYPGNPSSLTFKEIEKIKEEGMVTYLGHVDDLLPVISDCDIVILPSYAEGTPSIILEAAAMEKPVVVTDIAGCRGLVQNEVNGLLIPIRDAEALAGAIEVLVKDSELRHKMGKAGRDIVLKEFEENIVLKKTLDVYLELLN